MRKRKRVFRHKLTIEEFRETGRDEYNEPIREWTEFATVRGEVDPLRGREFFASRQVQAEQTHRISFRYIKGVKPTMRIRWGERIFEIVAPALNPYEANYEIQLMCKEKVPG